LLHQDLGTFLRKKTLNLGERRFGIGAEILRKKIWDLCNAAFSLAERNKYFEKYWGKGKKIYLFGVEFIERMGG